MISLEVVLCHKLGMFTKPHLRHTQKGQTTFPDISRQLLWETEERLLEKGEFPSILTLITSV